MTGAGSIHAFTLQLLKSAWFRGIAPVVVAVAFELALRYIGLSDRSRWKREDAFIALALTGIAVAALPGLIAIRVEDLHSTDAVAAGCMALGIVAVSACWLARFDRRRLKRWRRDDDRMGGLLVATMAPNIVAGIVLGLIFALTP